MSDSFDAVIVLGRGFSATGGLPDSVKKGVVTAVELYQNQRTKRLIFSGRWPRQTNSELASTEAAAMKELAVSLGVPAEAIATEDQSLDTISNFYYLKTQILLPLEYRKILLLTVPEHGHRSAYLMRKILGPNFECQTQDIEFRFPPEKHKALLVSEQAKLARLKQFLADIPDGDHEAIFRKHLLFITGKSS